MTEGAACAKYPRAAASAVSGTEEECLADAELCNRVMEEGSAYSVEDDYLSDELLDAQLAEAGRELGEGRSKRCPRRTSSRTTSLISNLNPAHRFWTI